MKANRKFYQTLLLAVLFSWSCNKEKVFGDGYAENVPLSVNLGESQIFINGQLVEFKPDFERPEWNYERIYGRFFHKSDDIFDVVRLSSKPIEVGINNNRISFERCKDCEDGVFKQYEQVGLDTAFLEITAIDTIKMEIQGRFQANFKKTFSRKLSGKSKYPDELCIQGVFNERYFTY